MEPVNIKDIAQGTIDETIGGGGVEDENSIVREVITFLIGIAVGASVIMIIVGGIRYVISAGNQEKVTGAKSTIMYAIIGLIITLLAAVIVNFVFDQTTDVTTNGEGGNNSQEETNPGGSEGE